MCSSSQHSTIEDVAYVRAWQPILVLVVLIAFLLAACNNVPAQNTSVTLEPVQPTQTRTRVPTATSARRAAGTATAKVLSAMPVQTIAASATPTTSATEPRGPSATPTLTVTPTGVGTVAGEVAEPTEEARGRKATGTPTVTATLPPIVSTALPAIRIPLTDMGTATYYGFEGGLYPNGQNVMPPEHAAEGLRRAQLIQPLDTEGNPDPEGKIVLLSIGLSVTTMEFCKALGLHSPTDGVTCRPESFVGLSQLDREVNHDTLVFLNGAYGGQEGLTWDSPDDPNYDRIALELMPPQGLSEKQVQVVWLKVVNSIEGRPPLPAPDADAFSLMATHGNIVRALYARYPNLQQVYVTSRNYAGYASRALNPEPYAYETGFAIKWLIEAQIRQMATREVDPIAGDLSYDTAPWLAWGPYLWADGANPRSDGVFWLREHFGDDGTHPSVRGRKRVGELLLEFFKTEPYTRCWFLAAHPPCAEVSER